MTEIAVKQFKAPKKSLGDLDAEVAARLITATADVALVLDRKGVIRDVACDDDQVSERWCTGWVGKPWVDTVTVESRPKVEEMLREAAGSGRPRWRQVNHPNAGGNDLPVQYAAVGLGNEGRVIAVGRELSAVASLQQRLVKAQQSLETEYQRLRQVETRYRALFQFSTEAILIVDCATLKVVEANPAAVKALANGSKRVVGLGFLDLVDRTTGPVAQSYLMAVQASPARLEGATVTSAAQSQRLRLVASLVRQDQSTYYLVRLTPASTDPAATTDQSQSRLVQVIERLPEAFVVTDLDRRILMANAAFLEMTQIATEAQAKGQPIDRWLGRVEVDVDVMMANLREHGTLRRYLTVIRGEYGSREGIEVSAVAVEDGEVPCLAFSIRKSSGEASRAQAAQRMPKSVEQLTELVGRVPLKELVRETTDIIEKLCMEAALELTGDNRASAAEMLGLSRQSFYVKMRRFGLE